VIGGRFASNIGYRFVYPFLPAIARGLGVSIETVGVALSVRELSGLAAPAVGRLIDAGRRRAGMVVGLLAAGGSLLLTAASPGIVAFAVGIVAFSVAKTAYDTAMSTWIGDHVPFAQRGRIIGLSELSWAASLLVGIPLVGWSIDAIGWRAPFVWVGAACAVVALVLPRVLPEDRRPSAGPRPRLRIVPGSLGLYAAVGLLSWSIQLVIVVHGVWLERELGLTVATIGLASILLGLAELAGSGGTVTFTDRIGKRRAVLVGTMAMVPPLALLGTVDGRVALGLGLLALSVLAFEFAFVSALPLVTEIDPEARGGAVGVAIAVVTLSRAAGTAAATPLYSAWGMGTVGAVAAVGVAVTAALVALAVREPAPDRLEV
jgi:predicted MFS family arabinose efflux permease